MDGRFRAPRDEDRLVERGRFFDDLSRLGEFSIIHLLPSRSLGVGFFVRILSRLVSVPGMEDLLLWRDFWEEEREGAEGTAEEVRREGFLCIGEEGSTLRRCEVTEEARDI